MSRLIELLVALGLAGLALIVIGPVAATVLTPDWIETADARDWASMMFFLCIAAALLLGSARLAFRRASSGRAALRARDWWLLVTLTAIATVCVAIASNWVIALPGVLLIAAGILLARRRARRERLVLVDADPSELPPRASFTGQQSRGPRPM